MIRTDRCNEMDSSPDEPHGYQIETRRDLFTKLIVFSAPTAPDPSLRSKSPSTPLPFCRLIPHRLIPHRLIPHSLTITGDSRHTLFRYPRLLMSEISTLDVRFQDRNSPPPLHIHGKSTIQCIPLFGNCWFQINLPQLSRYPSKVLTVYHETKA